MQPSATLTRIARETCGRYFPRSVVSFFFGSSMAWLGLCQQLWAFDGEPAPEGVAYFESRVRPVLVEHCYGCHSQAAGESNGEMLLDSRPAMLRGGTRGSVLAAPSPDRSLLIRAIEYQDPEIQMPPDGKIPDAQIDALRKWIEMGAPDPRQDAPAIQDQPSMDDRIAEASIHWAYQALQPPALAGMADSPAPALADRERWVRDPIDDCVLKQLSAHGLSHSEDADRRTLIRRLYYDLLGLPPTLADLDRWLSDRDRDWYERLVRSLLASPHFGERMARHWMDVMRYADNKGYVFQEDREYPYAYRYRDWLIRSFNEDLPFDDFVRYQLIGDRLDPDNALGHLDAMGMITLGRRFLQNKNDIIDDRIDVVSRGLLGITASCARCHDHKFDPVTTADYYSLHAMFADSEEPGDDPSPLRLVDKASPSKAFIFLRGNPGNRGPEIERRFFGFLKHDSPLAMTTGSGRLEMVDAIVDPDNPLTARVYVNRVWGWLTGRPLVDTPSDFGLRCESPAYRAILDDLAWDFIEHGWSNKKLIERIVLTSTYRQSSRSDPESLDRDPENRWLWRANRRRMDFESHRDAMLGSAGCLDLAIGGKSVVIHAAPFAKRRTVYAYIDRQNLPQVFRSFDFASPDAHVPQRAQTTVPQQSLVLMNSEWILDLLQSLVREIERASGANRALTSESEVIAFQVQLLFQKLLARQPSAAELERTVDFMNHCDNRLVSTAENSWQYGYGRLDSEAMTLQTFERLPKFENGQWSGAGEVPDRELGWTLLNAKGGHPGKSLEFCPVRRWTAPRSGELTIRGKLEHESEEGDGVRATILKNQNQSIGTWSVKKSKASTEADGLAVMAGDTIDLVVDCLEHESHDSFLWSTVFQYRDSSDRFDSKVDFSGMQPTPASPLQQAAQALLMTNEFCFVD